MQLAVLLENGLQPWSKVLDFGCGALRAARLIASDLPRTKWNNLPKPDVKIGHSVWIGSNVLLKRNVTIGTGSLVAARSVVTKDVPPYTLVAGNPAIPRGKFDGRRHPAELIERLLLSEWWAYNFTDFHGLDTTDPERFLDGFEVAVQQGRLQRYDPGVINLPDALLGIS